MATFSTWATASCPTRLWTTCAASWIGCTKRRSGAEADAVDGTGERGRGGTAVAKSGRAGRIALAQVNPTVGDLAGNRAIMERALAEARQAGADLVVFPELALTGCPPEDLVLRRDFLAAVDEHLHALAWASRDMTVIVGAPWEAAGGVVNGAVVLADGRV